MKRCEALSLTSNEVDIMLKVLARFAMSSNQVIVVDDENNAPWFSLRPDQLRLLGKEIHTTLLDTLQQREFEEVRRTYAERVKVARGDG